MRGTLSQPTRPETVRNQPVFRWASARPRTQSKSSRRGVEPAIRLSIAAALIFSTSACGDAERPAEPATRIGETRDDVATPEATFSWPEDPSHPVLEVSIDSPESRGTILIELIPELAPATVVSVIELANAGFYDGTTFHRVIPGFMLQGGDPNSRDRDPNNDGKGASGRRLHDEFGEAPFLRGVVGMGNKGRAGSTSTQFFIMHADNQNLDGRYTAVGRVVSGMDLVDDLAKAAIDRAGRWGPKDRPIENITMTKVHTIGQVSTIRAALKLEAQAAATSRFEAADVAVTQTNLGTTPSPPARLDPNDDWQRLEASAR